MASTQCASLLLVVCLAFCFCTSLVSAGSLPTGACCGYFDACSYKRGCDIAENETVCEVDDIHVYQGENSTCPDACENTLSPCPDFPQLRISCSLLRTNYDSRLRAATCEGRLVNCWTKAYSCWLANAVTAFNENNCTSVNDTYTECVNGNVTVVSEMSLNETLTWGYADRKASIIAELTGSNAHNLFDMRHVRKGSCVHRYKELIAYNTDLNGAVESLTAQMKLPENNYPWTKFGMTYLESNVTVSTGAAILILIQIVPPPCIDADKTTKEGSPDPKVWGSRREHTEKAEMWEDGTGVWDDQAISWTWGELEGAELKAMLEKDGQRFVEEEEEVIEQVQENVQEKRTMDEEEKQIEENNTPFERLISGFERLVLDAGHNYMQRLVKTVKADEGMNEDVAPELRRRAVEETKEKETDVYDYGIATARMGKAMKELAFSGAQRILDTVAGIFPSNVDE